MDVDVYFPNTRIPDVNRIARNALGKVVLFVNDERTDTKYEHLLMLGLIEDFTTIITETEFTTASFQLTEVI